MGTRGEMYLGRTESQSTHCNSRPNKDENKPVGAADTNTLVLGKARIESSYQGQ
jgi:hypothetical protein